MAKRSVVIRLNDIVGAIDEAREYLDGADFAAYQADGRTRRATERCIEIISEAARHIPEELTAKHADIPWDDIRAIGNLLRHKYQGVSDHVIWRTATKSLLELRPVIIAMLGEPDAE